MTIASVLPHLLRSRIELKKATDALELAIGQERETWMTTDAVSAIFAMKPSVATVIAVCLIKAAGRVVVHDELFFAWTGVNVSDDPVTASAERQSVRMNVHRSKQFLKGTPYEDCVQTHFSHGYSWDWGKKK